MSSSVERGIVIPALSSIYRFFFPTTWPTSTSLRSHTFSGNHPFFPISIGTVVVPDSRVCTTWPSPLPTDVWARGWHLTQAGPSVPTSWMRSCDPESVTPESFLCSCAEHTPEDCQGPHVPCGWDAENAGLHQRRGKQRHRWSRGPGRKRVETEKESCPLDILLLVTAWDQLHWAWEKLKKKKVCFFLNS